MVKLEEFITLNDYQEPTIEAQVKLDFHILSKLLSAGIHVKTIS